MTRPGISLASNASQQPWKVDADPRTLSKKFSPGFTKLRACPEITHTVALGAESFSDERQHSSHHPGRIEEKDAFETYTAISFNFDSLILGQALSDGLAGLLTGEARQFLCDLLHRDGAELGALDFQAVCALGHGKGLDEEDARRDLVAGEPIAQMRDEFVSLRRRIAAGYDKRRTAGLAVDFNCDNLRVGDAGAGFQFVLDFAGRDQKSRRAAWRHRRASRR